MEVKYSHGEILPLGFWNWITTSSLKMLTSSIPGIVFTPILFNVLWSRLSSVVVVLWTAFFFLSAFFPHKLLAWDYGSRSNSMNRSYHKHKRLKCLDICNWYVNNYNRMCWHTTCHKKTASMSFAERYTCGWQRCYLAKIKAPYSLPAILHNSTCKTFLQNGIHVDGKDAS